jgi:hypothetical protein
LGFGWPKQAPSDHASTSAQRAEAIRQYGLDPTTSLESRVKKTPATVLKMFKELGGDPPAPHALTETERRKVYGVFAALPPLHRRVLRERLRSISFLDGIPNTALTSTVNPDEPYRLYDITIRAGILGERVSDWLTQKERTCFDGGGALNVSIEAGTLDAIIYVLLHEATHIVDSSLGLTPEMRSNQPARVATTFTEGVWTGATTLRPQYRDPLLERVLFRAGGEVLPIAQAQSVYAALRRTPCPSLYGSRNWYDDVAEYVTLYHLTEVLHQPYRIVIRKEGKEVFAYEPFKSDLVRGRAGQMNRFYDEKD